MKLFQQLLVAPAALGLMAPMAATATELNINGVSNYSATSEEVKSISSFSDVYPTDWAFKALVDLAERHGCAAATPSGAITRYEAAALINQCLANAPQINTEERRLVNEFAPEIAVIKGRVDSLEARVGEFEAGVFSKTTKLSGKASFVVGAVNLDETLKAGETSTTGSIEKTNAFYMYQLNMNTSFSGKDLLYTRIKTGNFAGLMSNTQYSTYLAATKTATDSALMVDKIWYQFPIGDSFKVWVGPKIENYYMLASAPSIYKPILKGFALGGNAGAYGASTNPGFGVAWTQQVDDPSQPRFAVSTSVVDKEGDNATGGFLTDQGTSNWLTKVEYGSPRWQVSLAMAVKEKDWTDSYFSTEKGKSRTGDSTNWGLRGYWKPESTGAIPAIQVGYDISTIDDDGATGSVEETNAWMVGLMWKDAFIDGNTAGLAIGQAQHATEIVGGTSDPSDDNSIWEAYYSFKVSDNVTVTPAIFGSSDSWDGNDDATGYIVQTDFRF